VTISPQAFYKGPKDTASIFNFQSPKDASSTLTTHHSPFTNSCNSWAKSFSDSAISGSAVTGRYNPGNLLTAEVFCVMSPVTSDSFAGFDEEAVSQLFLGSHRGLPLQNARLQNR
jgi:hypothetical protein